MGAIVKRIRESTVQFAVVFPAKNLTPSLARSTDLTPVSRDLQT
jgi:hypothetical protein